jgi:hypothetical protein
LTEIGALKVENNYNEKIYTLFTSVLSAVNTMIPPTTGKTDTPTPNHATHHAF